MSRDTSPFEGWRSQYRSSRYLEYASEAELFNRADAVVRNTLAMLDYYNFEGVRADLANEGFVRALTELRLEFVLRGRPFPPSRAFIREIRSVSGSPARLRSAEATIRAYPRAVSPYLVKYLRRQYAPALAVDGILRLTPASFYKDPSLDVARHDDEQMRSLQNGPLDVGLFRMGSHRRTYFTQTISYGAQLETDYYVLSLSRMLNPRLFFAFRVDACVVVRDPQAFIAALEAALPEKRWRLTVRPIEYVDPWPPDPPNRPPRTPEDLCFMKDYSFCYQQEVRVVLLPEEPVQGSLSPISVQLAKPSGFCDLLVLPENNA